MPLVIPPGALSRAVTRFRPTAGKMLAVAEVMREQVDARFASGGASGGVTWARRRTPSDRPLLAGLRGSFGTRAEPNAAVVYSDHPAAAVHQYGTQGKGGTLPDITPKRAKSLFVPLTERARLAGPRPVRITGSGGRFELSRSEGGGEPLTSILHDPLMRGRVKNGRLQRKTDEGWEDGTPDFLLLSKVSIPPRPMLPTSPAERQATVQKALDVLAGPDLPTPRTDAD